MRFRVPLAASIVATCLAVYATNTPTGHPGVSPARANYSAASIVEYLAFSSGPIVSDHPQIRRIHMGSADKLTSEQKTTAATWLAGCIDHYDASASSALEFAFNSADPARIDSALMKFDQAANQWLGDSIREASSPCPPPPSPPNIPPGEGGSGTVKVSGDIALWHVAAVANVVAAGVSVTVGAVFNVAVAAMAAAVVAATVFVGVALVLVPVLITYQFESTPSPLDRENAIAELARVLRT